MGGLWKISIVLLLKYSLFTDKTFAQEVAAALERAEITPFIVTVDPSVAKLEVRYSTGVAVELGNRLTPTQTGQMPDIWVPDGVLTNGALYTMVVQDLQLISGDVRVLSSLVQWMVGNIPGQQVLLGETIVPYAGPVPLPATGDHCILFTYFQQNARLVFDEDILGTVSVRPVAFDLRQFAAKYDLGNPIAVNFFITRSDVTGTVRNALTGLVIS